MIGKGAFVRVLAAAVLAGGMWCGLASGAEEPKNAPATGPNSTAKSGKVVGIVTARTDADITIKPEGAQETQRYLLAPAGGTVNPTVQAELKKVFIPNLVALQWQRQDEAVVTSLHVIVPKVRKGSVAGTVVGKMSTDKEIYADVKPAGQGFTERYWPPFVIDPGTHKGGFDMKVIETIGKLNAGDKVQVDWYYDERKRAAKVQVFVRAPAPKPTAKE